jgi:ribosomal protein L7/L12
VEDYKIIRDFMRSSQKIAALKHLRQTGKRTIPDNSYPTNPYMIGLKEAKDFCEQHYWN